MTNRVSKILSDETLNRIIQIESAGKLRAKAPTSSALGLFQFLNGTWLDTVRKHRPDLLKGHTQAQVLALRTDPKIGIEIGARFTEDNARALGAGFTDGDLYLAHFLGIGTARKFLRAAPGASAEVLAGAAAVRANRSILAGKMAGQVRAWAQRSMMDRWESAGKPNWVAKYYVAGQKAGLLDDPDAENEAPEEEPAPAPSEAPAVETAPAPDAAVQGDPEVWHVQRRLKAMKYNPGGLDGKWGGMTAGAITGFMNDRHMPCGAPTSLDMFHDLMTDLKAELARAEAESFTRPVSEERANADPAKVATVAPEVVPVKRNFLATVWAAVCTFFVALYNAVADHVKAAWEFFTDHKDDLPEGGGFLKTAWGYVGAVPTWIWIMLAACGLGFIAWNAFKGVKRITQAVQTGERP